MSASPPPVLPTCPPLHRCSLPLRLHWFLSQTYVVLALFSHSEPLYLHISKGWSCHGVVPLPVTITVNMGAQCLGAIRFVHVLLYLNISLTPHPPTPVLLLLWSLLSSPLSSSFPLCLLHHPSALFSVKGGLKKQVCLSSVYSMCPLCPHAPRVPWTVPAECALCRRWELLMSLCTYLWNTCDSYHWPL